MSQIRIYTSVGPRIEAFIRRHRNKTINIATGFLSPNVDRAISQWNPKGLRLLVGLDPANCRVSPELDRCLQRIRSDQMLNVRLLGGLHAKLYVSPGREVIVASANLSQTGFERLIEVAVQTDDPKIVSGAEKLFAAWWKKSKSIRTVRWKVVRRDGAGDDTFLGLGCSPNYKSAFRGTKVRRDRPGESTRTPEEVIHWLISEPADRKALVELFARYIAALPPKKNRWELTQTDYYLRLNVGPLTCLEATTGVVGMHVGPLRSQLRRRIERIGRVTRGLKASNWFTPGALWVEIPLDRRAAELCEVLLPKAIAFAQLVKRRTSWMRAHNPAAVNYFARESGKPLPDPRAG